ncbi:hypothetical protein KUTeg_005104 [Tegillarca granosa]|uniref:Phospholysine phosphohistidine inorganic pyrophosphate phosphatase n=1 Tax=Tegillarca granosa TaxID=220873 RepID=A0ABQ9FLP2_TEGGR|nr:hypothetical protein KUTeg_005104 [Tegillarca granosa]
MANYGREIQCDVIIGIMGMGIPLTYLSQGIHSRQSVRNKRQMANWCKPSINGVLLDITGVLYDSGHGDGTVIPGSVDAVKRLRSLNIPVRFCTNETTKTRKMLVDRLTRLGFTIQEQEVFPPIPAILYKKNKNEWSSVSISDALDDFKDVDQSDPNCVVIGDATNQFSYENLNKAFRLLMSLKQPVLISLGIGKYYKEGESLTLDYACDVKAEIVGKPSKAFFNTALQDLGCSAENVVMIGDDIVNDVGGAQACGMRGIQVRTGKYRPQDENHPDVKPDGYVDNLAEAVDIIFFEIIEMERILLLQILQPQILKP